MFQLTKWGSQCRYSKLQFLIIYEQILPLNVAIIRLVKKKLFFISETSFLLAYSSAYGNSQGSYATMSSPRQQQQHSGQQLLMLQQQQQQQQVQMQHMQYMHSQQQQQQQLQQQQQMQYRSPTGGSPTTMQANNIPETNNNTTTSEDSDDSTPHSGMVSQITYGIYAMFCSNNLFRK